MINDKCILVLSSNFKKQYKKVSKQGKDLDKIDYVIDKLARHEELEPKYKDHKLSGIYEGKRECHIEPDWLLLYRKFKDKLILSATDTGTHADIFGE